jgi:predicted MFS family arabinose efflux permease
MLAVALPFIAYAPWKWPFVLLMIPIAWGQGMNNTATAALASQLTPPDEQGALFGVLQAMQGLGRIAGPLVGSLAFARRGYAAPYLLASGCICLGLLLAVSVIRPAKAIQDGAA